MKRINAVTEMKFDRKYLMMKRTDTSIQHVIVPSQTTSDIGTWPYRTVYRQDIPKPHDGFILDNYDVNERYIIVEINKDKNPEFFL